MVMKLLGMMDIGYWIHAIKFALWQHPAVGHGAKFA